MVSFLVLLNSCRYSESDKINPISEAYVKLVLNVGLYDADYVDAYYGPDHWKPAEQQKKETFPYELFSAQIETLMLKLERIERGSLEKIEKQRHAALQKQFLAVKAKINMLNGTKYTFDQESAYLYDAVAPSYSAAHFDSLLGILDSALPGPGSVSERYIKFKQDFIIPADKLQAVFNRGIEECRKRSLKYINLPANENFTVEYVTDKAWGAYNWYKGNSYSLIQVNTDFPTQISSIIRLAAHEGYPGHHVFNALLEKNLVSEKGWSEYLVYPLFSPQSLIAEGSANSAVDFIFPANERIEFEKKILFPLAGLEADKAEKYYKILDITRLMSYAGNEAARNYLDGKITALQAEKWLTKYSLSTAERAKQRIRFFDKYRSYVINYNLGKDIVKNYIEKKSDGSPESKWKIFIDILSTPYTASMLM